MLNYKTHLHSGKKYLCYATMGFIKKWFLLCIPGFLCLPLWGMAQSGSNVDAAAYWQKYLIRNFTAEQGLPSSSVFLTGQDSQQFIWFGTRDGIARFDGKTMTPFSGSDYPQIRMASIYSMREDSEGTLWFSANENLLISYKNGRFTSSAANPHFPANLSKYIEITPGDSIWVSFYGGLSLVYKDSVLATYTTKNGLVYNDIWTMKLDSKGALWVGTNNGISIIRGDSITNFTTANGLSHNVIRAVAELNNGEIWVGTDGGGITVFEHYKPKKHIGLNDGLTGAFIQFIAQHPADNSVWLANYENGIDVLKDGSVLNFNTSEGLISNMTNHIFFDDRGIVWIATEDGVSQLRPRKLEHLALPGQLSDTRVNSLYKSGNGEIWIGLNGDGIIHGKPGNWQHIPPGKLKTNAYVDVFLEHPDGGMWYGTQGSGVELLSDTQNRQLSMKDGLPGDYNGNLLYDGNQNLWISTQSGLSVFTSGGLLKSYSTDDGLPSNFIYAMAKDSLSRLWVSTYASGIFTLEANHLDSINFTIYDTTNVLRENQITTIWVDHNQNVWLGGGSGSIHIYDGKNFKIIPELGKNLRYSIAALMIDSDNFVWLATNIGLFQAEYDAFFTSSSYADIPFKYYSLHDGLPGPSHPLPHNKLIEDDHGNIYVATFNGVGFVPRAEKFRQYEAPTVYFDKIEINGQRVIPERGQITFKTKDQHLEIGISSPSFYAPEKIKYLYKLEGVENEWKSLTNRSSLYYDYLPDGSFVLKVMASNEMENWDNAGFASIKIRVLPPFYKTWWFMALTLLLFGGLVAGLIKLRYRAKMKALDRELATQHQIQAERERISRDLHDNVGAHITNLITGLEISTLHIKGNQYDEAFSILHNLDTDARGAMTELRETIWLLDQKKIPIANFEKHVSNFLKRQLSTTELAIDFRNEIGLGEELNPAQSLHLLRIIQECLNNCRKHARARHFSIAMKKNNGIIEVKISDDGRGIENLAANGGGNGLKNMHRRASELKGQLSINSTPGSGTEITLRFPAQD